MNKEDINSVLKRSASKISSYLKIHTGSLKKIAIKKQLYGHNSKVYLIDFIGADKDCLGRICVKYSLQEKARSKLKAEYSILKLLLQHESKKICPEVIDIQVSEENNSTCIIMEAMKHTLLKSSALDIKKASLILDCIKIHEAILIKNIENIKSPSLKINLRQKIDFERKICELLEQHVPHITLQNSLTFLNDYLNTAQVIRQRTLVTDRSIENILQNLNNEIILIDFSTIRIGTQFDNWIQFIDDPRAHFSCKKADLVDLFFKREKLHKENTKLYYAASIYTNLLQGIFTYKKNKKLGVKYFENANAAFMGLINKKDMLININ